MSESIHPETHRGHVYLRVAALRRATDFYHDVLGFDITLYGPDDTGGVEMAFLSVGGYHHHIGPNTFQNAGSRPPPPGRTGLYHLAIVYPSRRELARALRRVLDHGYAFTGGEDDGIGERVYLGDPDGNGPEPAYDRPREQWTDEEGKLTLSRQKKVVPEDLLAELDPA